jgi:hypothetical protein
MRVYGGLNQDHSLRFWFWLSDTLAYMLQKKTIKKDRYTAIIWMLICILIFSKLFCYLPDTFIFNGFFILINAILGYIIIFIWNHGNVSLKEFHRVELSR